MQKLFPVEGKTLPEWRFPEFIGGSEWSLKTLGEICVNYDSLRVPITEKDRITGNIPYIGASGIIDYIHDFIFNDDLLCVSEDGANLLARTYPIAFGISGKTWVNNHAHVLKFKFKFKNYLDYPWNCNRITVTTFSHPSPCLIWIPQTVTSWLPL